jgi:hypothetical protein
MNDDDDDIEYSIVCLLLYIINYYILISDQVYKIYLFSPYILPIHDP